MAQVNVWINGYSYLVGCEDGQESHLEAMAAVLQKRVNDVKSLGQQGEARVLLLAALLLADDLHDKEVALASALAGRAPVATAEPVTVIDPEFDATVHRLAAKAEEIADALERS
ncbi:MAG TPA: cell division protein ZapA [Acidisoma sp.]|jgi:cell division protein ZapA|uniref:cell division protein ZapA n=1 Tax=Acidisoma sp. TaxID=1872115 RepID=UPI002D07192A|nr:cell division protein ZapA [Acidisoma sp.]HTI00646.1 cell division protein ZapA [Acidisoma sp.]